MLRSARRLAKAALLQEARSTCRAATQKHPFHFGCQFMRLRLEVAQRGCVAAVKRLVMMVQNGGSESEYGLLVSALRRLRRRAQSGHSGALKADT
jgi:hypothetical protein